MYIIIYFEQIHVSNTKQHKWQEYWNITVLKAMHDDYHAICKTNKISSHKVSGRCWRCIQVHHIRNFVGSYFIGFVRWMVITMTEFSTPPSLTNFSKCNVSNGLKLMIVSHELVEKSKFSTTQQMSRLLDILSSCSYVSQF